MSNDLTITTQDDGWADAAADANSRLLRGSLMTFSDGRWYRGKEKVEIKEGARFAAVGTSHFWQRWFDKKPTETIVREPGKRLPERESLGEMDESEWETGLSGEPKDPWQETRGLYLIDPMTAEALTFTTSSWAGRGAVADLGDQIVRMRQAHPGAIPIIEIGWAPHVTKFGRKTKPVLKVVEWKRGGSLVPGDEPVKQIAHADTKSAKAHETANLLNDEIGF